MRKLLILAALMLAQKTVHAETIYRATININGRIFHDLMAFDSFPSSIDDQRQNLPLRGTLTVPGAFTVPMTGQYTGCTKDNGPFCIPYAEVSITVDEGNGPYKINYKLLFGGPDISTFGGEATLEDGTVLGPLQGLRIFMM
jgi:hypothetical protein